MGPVPSLDLGAVFDGFPRWAYEVAFAAYAVLVAALVLSERRRPTATLAWILALVFLPLLGLLFYLVFGRNRIHRRRRRRRRRACHPFDETAELAAVETLSPNLSPVQAGLVRLGLSVGAAPLRRCETLEVLDTAERLRAALFDAVEAAERNIHLEYYIWKDDASGRALTERLVRKARAGVRVRVLFDFVGSLGLPAAHFRALVEAGGEVRAFAPVRVPLPTRLHHLNFRNHRKIAVIDGHTGFVGGANVGDEYLGGTDDRGAWHDLALRMTGDAVLSLDAIFLEDWLEATGELLDLEARPAPAPDRAAGPLRGLILGSRLRRPAGPARSPFPAAADRPARSAGTLVQIIPSGPDTEVADSIALQTVAAVTAARRRILVATAYFVPDEPTMAALRTAALRGVDVRILVPSPQASDQRLVAYAGRSYYDDLLAAGCRIFEFQDGMLHAKCIIVDEDVCLVGSANMDIRSFYLNYEVTALVYGAETTAALARVFADYERRAEAVTRSAREGSSGPSRMIENLARTLSPLL